MASDSVQRKLIIWQCRSDELNVNTSLSISELNQFDSNNLQTDNKNNSWGEIEYIFDYIGQNQIRGNIARIEHEQNAVNYKNIAKMALLHQICPECRAQLKPWSTPQGNYWVCSNYPKCAYKHKM